MLRSSYANLGAAGAFLSSFLSLSFLPAAAAGAAAASSLETTRQYNDTVWPVAFDGSYVTVNGMYCLLPVALRKSSCTHASPRSFGDGCPAATPSTNRT